MKLKKLIFPIIAVSLVLGYCANPETPQNDIQESSDDPAVASGTDTITSIADEHTSQNSLDWAGTYVGTLPCADCEGIKTTVELNSDNTYIMKEEYLGTDVAFDTKGEFTWDSEGRIITLTDEDTHRNFQVRENNLLHLDQDGNAIEGGLADYYILQKQ